MEPTAENMGHLVGFLAQTVSADPAARKAAEAQLGAAKVQQGYALLLLRVVVAGDADPNVRLQGAIQFKNLVNQHLLSVSVGQVIVVAFPLLRVGIWWQARMRAIGSALSGQASRASSISSEM